MQCAHEKHNSQIMCRIIISEYGGVMIVSDSDWYELYAKRIIFYNKYRNNTKIL